MKKSVVLSLLGFAVAATTTAYGQGGINISNYRGAYNQVVWDASVPAVGGSPVLSTQGVMLQLWYGRGVLASGSLLTDMVPLTWHTTAESQGYFGYYNSVTLSLANYVPGDSYTFQVRAFGDSTAGVVDAARSQSVLWQENANITDQSINPPPPPGISTESIGLTVYVPEPASLTLLGLGAAGLMIFRRRS